MSDDERPKLTVSITPDSLEAQVDVVSPGSSVTGILAILREHDIGMGIRHQAIADAVKKANEGGQPVRKVVAARGVRPRRPQAAQATFRLPGRLSDVPDLEYVTTAFGTERKTSLERACRSIAVWLVRPGDVVWGAVVDFGEPGVDLMGRVTPPPRPRPPSLPQLGDGVEASADGTLVVARRFGFAGWFGGRLTVLPPVWVDAAEAVALVVRLPAHGESVPPTAGMVRDAVESVGVVVGIDTDALRASCEGWPTTEEPTGAAFVEVARARPPTEPSAGEPEFHFEYAFRVGAELEDGRTDFKDRNIYPGVEEGALLAVCPPTDPGRAGVSVRGNALPADDVPATLLEAAENVRREETNDGEQRLYAERAGGASVRRRVVHSRKGRTVRYQVAVRPVVRIPGDVDLKTGHVRFNGNIEVAGSVRSGFELLANGDIVIKGRVDAGARVGARGNVTVHGGIVGADTRVSSRGNIKVRFIQAARVRAAYDILITAYCHEANIEAGGKVIVPGRGGHGDGLVGGLVWATGGVVSSNLGSASNPNTVIIAGVSGRLSIRREAIEAELKADERTLKMLLREHSVANPEALEMIFIAPGATDPRSIALWQAHELVAQCASHRADIEGLRLEAEEMAAVATVAAKRTCHPGTRVRIGPYLRTVRQTTHGVVFHLDPAGERGGVIATPARQHSRGGSMVPKR